MKEIFKSKVMRLFIALVFALTIIYTEDIKKASVGSTDNTISANEIYTISVTQN